MSEPLLEREMVKCEACGDYHYKDECEIVVIRLVKGKNCVLKPLTSTPQVIREVVKERSVDQESKKETTNAPETEIEIPRIVPKKNIIPPGVASMMLPPDHPGFEQFGAKERRTA